MGQRSLINSIIKKEYILMDLDCSDRRQVLVHMAGYAHECGLVKESYSQAVLDREEMYPTGLPTEGMRVALPHTIDKSHVIKSGVIIAKMKKPVIFKEMGEGINDIMVDMVFMLAVNGSDQVEVLQKLVGMFTDKSINTGLKNAGTKDEVLKIITENVS